MKAYQVHDKLNYENEGVSTIVFAENVSKAKTIALCTEACEGADWIDIRVERLPKADKLYRGKSEIDWYDEQDRITLVKDFGWACFETSFMCDKCPAKQWCRNFEGEVDQ